MDDCRFDNWTRMFSGIRDRRTALRDLTAAGAALVSLAGLDLGLVSAEDVQVEGCRLSGDSCDKDKQCCSGICKGKKKKKKKKNRNNNNNNNNNNKGKRNRDSGECKCLSSGSSCNRDAACCRGFCDANDGRCRCVGQGGTCNRDQDCCDGTCRSDNQGNRFCNNNRR
jgi:hypothetical protein